MGVEGRGLSAWMLKLRPGWEVDRLCLKAPGQLGLEPGWEEGLPCAPAQPPGCPDPALLPQKMVHSLQLVVCSLGQSQCLSSGEGLEEVDFHHQATGDSPVVQLFTDKASFGCGLGIFAIFSFH